MIPLTGTRFLPRDLQTPREIRSHHGNVVREACDRLEELAEQDEQAVAFHGEPDERPAQQNQENAAPERRGAPPFLPSREKHERSLGAQKKCDADQEEYVAHGE